jgi:hypothetical protein
VDRILNQFINTNENGGFKDVVLVDKDSNSGSSCISGTISLRFGGWI